MENDSIKNNSTNTFDVSSVNRIICIMSFTSSASCLMSSLLDNHPNILSFPDNVVSSFSEFWQEFYSLPLEPLLDKFLDKYTTIFDARTVPNGYEGTPETGEARGYTTLGLERNEYLKVNQASFRTYMKVFLGDSKNITRKLFFQAMHVAYAKALNRSVINPIIVFGLHSLTHPGRIKALMEDFSDVYFLTMVRHPLNATGSRLRAQIRNGIGISHFHRIITGISGAGATDPSTKNSSWRAVRMEDLHQFPKETMENVSNWIDLPWNKILLESTINGKKWWNEKQGIQTSGFNSAIASQTFEDYLSKLDSLRLYIMLNRKCSAWSYKTPWWSNSFFSKLLVFPLFVVPFKIEIIAWLLMSKSILNSKEKFIMKTWLLLRVIIGGYGLGRIGLFRAWLFTIRGHQTEVELLIAGMRIGHTVKESGSKVTTGGSSETHD
jgi:hypothetical protein